MRVTQRERKAGASGIAFTAAVLLAITICVAMLVWRAGAGETPNGPPAFAQSR